MTKESSKTIEWIEKYEQGEVQAQDYAGSWKTLMAAVGSGATDPDSARDLIARCVMRAGGTGETDAGLLADVVVFKRGLDDDLSILILRTYGAAADNAVAR